MEILVVCTGNVCRSPMGELMLANYLKTDSSIHVSSAGTRGLPGVPIHPSSGRLMRAAGIDPSGFRSRRLTEAIAEDADLILCFERKHRERIVLVAPQALNNTFLFTEFADICQYCGEHGLVKGDTMAERLQTVIGEAPMVRPLLSSTADDIADPIGKDFEHFRTAAIETNTAIVTILNAVRKQKG